MKILFLEFMSKIKVDLTLKKSNFLFLLCRQIAVISIYSNTLTITTETQLLLWSFKVKFDTSRVLTGYDIGGNGVCN